MTEWIYENKPFIEAPTDMVGFIYRITNLTNNKKYIGKKLFTSAGIKQVKGKRKKIRKESNWLEYYGSNAELQEDVKTLGKENFKREIIKLCKTKGDTGYYECKQQMIEEVLERDDYYNYWLSARVRKSHLSINKT